MEQTIYRDNIKAVWCNPYGYEVEFDDFLEERKLEDNTPNYYIFAEWLIENGLCEAI